MPTPIQSDHPLNQIFYGPPGTGKTYKTVDAAVKILSPTFFLANQDDRKALKVQFDSLAAAGHVRFVTFHQSFSYEDFVEGIRAESDEVDGQLRYEVVDGVFKSLCDAAAAKVTQQADAPVDLNGRRIWKMSLGAAVGADSYIFDDCIENAYALLGYGLEIDFSDCTDRPKILQKFLAKDSTVKNDSYAVTAVSTFLLKIKIGDLLVVTDGNSKFRAIGEITGNYRYLDRSQQADDYTQCRDVKWLRVYKPSLPLDQLMNNKFSQMTLYELRPSAIALEKLGLLLKSRAVSISDATAHGQLGLGEVTGTKYKIVKSTADIVELKKPNGNSLPIAVSMLTDLVNLVRSGQISIEDIKEKRVFEKLPNTDLEPYLVNEYANLLPVLVEQLLRLQQLPVSTLAPMEVIDAKVLIIDEINRGNVSRIFGELITLIEPSKRAGAAEALQVTLPYSKEAFSVPLNLYIVGTMNTADRSLAGLDIALRRRFDFQEMAPRAELFDDVVIDGINVGTLLRVMNERIELLLDRDHCLGHAYFISLYVSDRH